MNEYDNHCVNIPKSIQSTILQFNQYYTKKYLNRVVTWKFGHGSAEIVGHYDGDKNYVFLVSGFQMLILMLF